MELRQREGCFLVRLDRDLGDERHMRRVDEDDRVKMGHQLIREVKGVGGQLQHHGILAGEGLGDPEA
jgi:hypothetical protein